MATSSDDDTQLNPVVETIPGIAALVVLAVLSLVVMTRTCILRQRLRLRVQSATLEAKENEKERPKLHEVCCEEAGSVLEKSAMVGWTRIMPVSCACSTTTVTGQSALSHPHPLSPHSYRLRPLWFHGHHPLLSTSPHIGSASDADPHAQTGRTSRSTELSPTYSSSTDSSPQMKCAVGVAVIVKMPSNGVLARGGPGLPHMEFGVTTVGMEAIAGV